MTNEHIKPSGDHRNPCGFFYVCTRETNMQIKGYVEKIIYTNSDNGHTILDVSLTSDEIKRLQAECPDYADDIDEEMVCVGTLHLINAGEYVVFNGDFTVHQT